MKRNIKNIQEIKGTAWYGWKDGGHVHQQEEMDDNQFFQIVKKIVSSETHDDLMLLKEPSYMEDRANVIGKHSKLFGVRGNDFMPDPDGLQHALYYAAMDNYDDIEEGKINTFEELKLRPLKTFDVDMKSDETEFVDYRWTVRGIKGYDANDVGIVVSENEDGIYDWWEYEDTPEFS